LIFLPLWLMSLELWWGLQWTYTLLLVIKCLFWMNWFILILKSDTVPLLINCITLATDHLSYLFCEMEITLTCIFWGLMILYSHAQELQHGNIKASFYLHFHKELHIKSNLSHYQVYLMNMHTINKQVYATILVWWQKQRLLS
jgi:hypothetical protein